MTRLDQPIFTHPPFTIHQRINAGDIGEQPQWWLTDTEVDELWDWSGGGEGVRVGIVDTGIDRKHLETGEVQVAESRDFTGSRSGFYDLAGHGTHVAGIIAARRDNKLGVIGLAPKATLFIAKGLGDDGGGTDQQVANAINWLCDKDCHIINLSLGSPVPSATIKRAVDRCYREGRLLFAAAGNEGGQDNVGYPAKYPNAFAVGAVDRNRKLANFSDRGLEVQGVGFGVKMISLYRNGQLSMMSGTSMATPWIAGMAANRLSAELKRAGGIFTDSLEKFVALFKATADDLGNEGHDAEYGSGFPLADKFIKYGLEIPALPPDVGDPVIPPGVPDAGDPIFVHGPIQITAPTRPGELFSVFAS